MFWKTVMRRMAIRRYPLLTLVFMMQAATAVAPDAWGRELKVLLDLRGRWRFEIGDDERFADPGFDDSRWDQVAVPSAWEDQGYPGYDGYAWYRKTVRIPAEWKGKVLYLRLGHVDDVDEVYINGHFVGFSGLLPPEYFTAYAVPREYYVWSGYLNIPGENEIAVRVYDHEMGGGIMSGQIGFLEQVDALVPDVDLAGQWKLKSGDDPAWSGVRVDDRSWKSVVVPSFWETQGLKNYDGFGWYRRTFTVPPSMAGKDMILLAGRIDDYDQVFVNGKMVGQTGNMTDPEFGLLPRDEYLRLRAYTIPASVLLPDKENIIAIRVFDGALHGGIYDAPVGLVTRERYLAWSASQRPGDKKKGPMEKFLEYFFR